MKKIFSILTLMTLMSVGANAIDTYINTDDRLLLVKL